MQSNAAARARFNREKDPPYLPHASLLYSDLPQSTKDAIASHLALKFPLRFTATGIAIYQAGAAAGEYHRVTEFSFKP